MAAAFTSSELVPRAVPILRLRVGWVPPPSDSGLRKQVRPPGRGVDPAAVPLTAARETGRSGVSCGNPAAKPVRTLRAASRGMSYPPGRVLPDSGTPDGQGGPSEIPS
ncbi:hypothetical protein GCM10022630_38550 [Thermobifida alba]